MTQLAVGDVLEGRYRIDHPIARGGMSTVYRCVDLRLGRQVAVKVMDDRYVNDPVFQSRFRREARAMAQLSHPNLVGVYDFSSDGDNIFLVMELITGGTLRELLAERGPMPPHAAAAVLKAVLNGLSLAHEQGMVHRDIKPDNILINGDHRVKIADFGLVRAASASTATSGQIVGTVSYLSPEQVDSSEISPATDVYSAGIVAFELLTGQTPFAGDTPLTHAYARLNQDVPAPSSLIDGVPPLIDALIATATARDPQERFADAGEFLDAVDDVAGELALPPFTVPVPQNSAAHRAAAVPTDTTGIPSITEHTSQLEAPGPQDTRVMGAAPEEPQPQPQPETTLEPESEEPPAVIASSSPAEKPVSNRSPWKLIIGLVVVIALTAAVAVGAWWFGSGRYGEIPQVLGMDRVEAVNQVQEAGFEPATEIIYHNEVPADEIAGTEPPAGEDLLPGEVVTVLVSQGQPTVPEIPAGVGVEDYRALAGERSLAVETGESVWSSEAASGTVATTQPPAGEAVPIGSTVTVALSKGPQPISVPDLEGLPLERAEQAMNEAGLNLGEVTEEFDDVIFGGNIITTDPGPGTRLERGDRVDVLVSTALRVPDITGMSLEDAEQALEDAGIPADTDRDNDEQGARADEVVGVSPEPGTLLNPEDDPEVTITLPGEITTPDVVGMTVEDARQRLEDVGLRIDKSSRDDDEVITEQDPAAGEAARDGERIDVELD